MAKRAVLIGCNYPGTKAELHGCVNDVSRMYKCLVDRFGFDQDDITVLIDTDKRSVQPTGANIKTVLSRVIEKSEPGDILVLHFSGHGTQVPAESGDEEDDGLDEAVVPTDLNLLTDDDFRLLLKNIQHGVHFTFISDSCHSGGLIDQEKEQIGGGDDSGGNCRSATRDFRGGYSQESEYGSGGGGYGREQSEYGYGGSGGGGYGGSGGGGYGEYGRRPSDYEYSDESRGRPEQGYGYEGRRQESGYGDYGGGYGGGYGEQRREEHHHHHHHGGRREEPDYREERKPQRHHYGRREESDYGESEGRGRQEYGSGYGRGDEEDSPYTRRSVKSSDKSLDIQTLAQMLSEQCGHEVKPGNIRTSLYDLFGEHASPTVKVFVNLIANKLSGGNADAEDGGEGGGIWGQIGGLALNFMKAKLNDSEGQGSYTSGAAQAVSSAVSQSGHAGAKPSRDQRIRDDVCVLVSGCQSNETSADANPTGDPSKAYGALSNAIQSVLAETRGPITNADLVNQVRALLQKQGFSQHPCLYCSDDDVEKVFICK